MSSNVLEQAREKVGGSKLELEDVYRRRAARQTRRRVAAGVTALMIFVIVVGLFARALERSYSKVPVATPTISVFGEGWVDVTPGSVKTYVLSGGCERIDGQIVPPPRPVAGRKDQTYTHASDCHGVASVDLRAVAGSQIGFVAVGDTSGGDGTDPVWFSPDGRSWARVPADSGPDSASLWDVVAGGPGFIAVGIDGRNEPAAWYSTDGLAWTAADVSLPSGIGNVDSMFGVTSTDAGFLAWGRVRNDDAYVWTSNDGRSWQSVPDESVFGGSGDEEILWIGQGQDRFVAGGYERPQPSGGEGHPAAWTSTDGLTWARLSNVTQSELDDLRASVLVTDHATAIGPTGSVQAAGQTIRFQPNP